MDDDEEEDDDEDDGDEVVAPIDDGDLDSSPAISPLSAPEIIDMFARNILLYE